MYKISDIPADILQAHEESGHDWYRDEQHNIRFNIRFEDTTMDDPHYGAKCKTCGKHPCMTCLLSNVRNPGMELGTCTDPIPAKFLPGNG